MNKDIIQGQWNILRGKVKENWGKLTDDDLTEINGKRDQLLGRLQKRYGYDKQKAEQELKHWEEKISSEFSESSEKIFSGSEKSFGSNPKNNREDNQRQNRDKNMDRR